MRPGFRYYTSWWTVFYHSRPGEMNYTVTCPVDPGFYSTFRSTLFLQNTSREPWIAKTLPVHTSFEKTPRTLVSPKHALENRVSTRRSEARQVQDTRHSTKHVQRTGSRQSTSRRPRLRLNMSKERVSPKYVRRTRVSSKHNKDTRFP
jgi:hypothetical protein